MGSNLSHFDRGDQYPVEKVSWNDCKDFIRKLNAKSRYTFRLPTEAEWEYAARSGGREEKYAGGSNVDRVAWYRRNSGGRSHKVGTKAPNGLGLYDMSGNVWEWCEDLYDEDAYTKHSRNNSLVTSGGSRRVNRGGSWRNNPRSVRAANRDWYPSDDTRQDLGFRLCLSRVR